MWWCLPVRTVKAVPKTRLRPPLIYCDFTRRRLTVERKFLLSTGFLLSGALSSPDTRRPDIHNAALRAGATWPV